MRKREGGQVFILVLILLAIGALLAVPALRLTGTALKSSQIITRQTKALYAADAAQEYVLWKLLYDAYGSEFTYDGEEKTLQFDCCDIPVEVTVIMRAVAGQGGVSLSTDDVIRPTKTVSPSTFENDAPVDVTYIIKLEQLSDNNTQGLDAVYDILPDGFNPASSDYVPNSSYLRVDGGSWESIDDPLIEVEATQYRLRWPASGSFESPIRDFAVRQVKEIKFKVTGTLPKNSVNCNWIVLKPWDTVSGPQAPITVGGDPANPGICDKGGMLAVDKVSYPQVIQPGVATDIEYTISITNQDGFTNQIEEIIDYLPPEFYYTGPTSNITASDPQTSLETISGVDRWKLRWTVNEFPQGNAVSIASGETLTLNFWARATKDVSGSYYNEVMVISDVPVPTIFKEIGVTDEDYTSCYSWNTGTVIVPAYDSQAEADGATVDANMSLTIGGVTITSWQAK